MQYGAPAIIKAHHALAHDVAFDPTGSYIVTAGMDAAVRLWKLPGLERAGAFLHEKSVNAVAFTADGGSLVTGSTDATVRMWSFPDGDLQTVCLGHERTIAAVAVTPDGKRTASASYDGTVRVWAGDECELVIEGDGGNMTSVALSANGELVAASGQADDVLVWSIPDGHPVARLKGHRGPVGSLRFGDAGLFSVGYDRTLRCWATGEWVEQMAADLDGFGSTAVSDDGTELATALPERVMAQSVDGAEFAELKVAIKGVYSVAYAPDRSHLAAVGADGRLRVWPRMGV